MKLIRRKVIVHGGKEAFIITPYEISLNVTAGHNNKGFVIIWGNGSGYKFLAECFSIAAELHKNEILYLPVIYTASEEFAETFQGCEYNYNIICTNYCETQMSPKEIEEILKVKVWKEDAIKRNPKINTEFIDRWKTSKRLTVKIHKNNMYISTNSDGFKSLSQGTNNMSEYGDEYIEDFLPHMHYDWSENTAASVGVTLYYWHDKEKGKF